MDRDSERYTARILSGLLAYIICMAVALSGQTEEGCSIVIYTQADQYCCSDCFCGPVCSVTVCKPK
jgi:hypothetical protein